MKIPKGNWGDTNALNFASAHRLDKPSAFKTAYAIQCFLSLAWYCQTTKLMFWVGLT